MEGRKFPKKAQKVFKREKSERKSTNYEMKRVAARS